MSKTKILFSGLFLAIFMVGNAYSGNIGDVSALSITFEQNPADQYQLAKSTFLPETYDDLGLSGRHNTKYDFNKNDCSSYPLSSCPMGATCTKCPFAKQYRITSCSSPYISTLKGCDCPALVKMVYANDKCVQYCSSPVQMKSWCIKMECTPNNPATGCTKGTQDCDDGCGKNTGKCCIACADTVTTKPANSSYTYSSCKDDDGTKNIQTGWTCNSGYHKTSGNTCEKDCNVTNCAGYTLSSCPANGTCSTCTKTAANCSTDGTMYRLDSCATGYSKSGDACVKAPATCQEYINQNNITGITFNSFTTTYLSGSYKGPKSVNYSKCQEMANPVITVTQPLSYAYFNVDNVDLVFKVPTELANEECESVLSNCQSSASNNSENFRNCMSRYLGSVNEYCSLYNTTECCPKTRVTADVNVSNVTLKDSNVTTPLGFTTGRTSGTLTIYGNTKITGETSTHTYDDASHSYSGGSIIIKEGANANIKRTECYLGTLTVEKNATLTTDAMGNNYQGGKDKNPTKSVQVYGTMKAKSFWFVNGPATIHEGGFLAINTVVKSSGSSTYEGRIYYKPGAKLQIGSSCKSTSSTGNYDFSNKTTIPTAPPSAFTTYCSAVSY